MEIFDCSCLKSQYCAHIIKTFRVTDCRFMLFSVRSASSITRLPHDSSCSEALLLSEAGKASSTFDSALEDSPSLTGSAEAGS